MFHFAKEYPNFFDLKNIRSHSEYTHKTLKIK